MVWFEFTPRRTLQWFEQGYSIGHSIQTLKEMNKHLEVVLLMGIEGNKTTVSKPMVALRKLRIALLGGHLTAAI